MRLRLDGRGRAILRRLPRTNVYSLAELVLLAVLAAQAARLIWAILTPVSPLGDWRPRDVTVPADARGVLTSFDPFFRSAPSGPQSVTSVQLTLYGIRLDGASGRGGAILAGPDKVQQSWSVGDEIVPGVRLMAVAFDHVTLDHGGRAEDLYLDQSGAATPPPPVVGDTTAGPGLLGASPDDSPASSGPYIGGGAAVSAGALRSDIGFIPRIDGGRVSGLTVRPQGAGAAFRRLGLRDGDVVTAIGGKAVTGAGDIDQLAAQLPAGGATSLTVERGSATLSIPVTIAR